MSQAEPLHVQDRYPDKHDAYLNLVEVISDIEKDRNENEDIKYSVAWATKNHDHGAEYRVINTGDRIPDNTLLIEGVSRGGKYEVVPHPREAPMIRYHHPKFGEEHVKWAEEATELIIMFGRFEHNQDEGFIDRIKNSVLRK